MKLCNININGEVHLAVISSRGVVDATAAGFAADMDEVIKSGELSALEAIAADESLPVVENPEYANIVNNAGKLICVGLNYADHASGISMKLPEYPILFSKFADSLVPSGAKVDLPSWETSYDYEAELVIVIGKECWAVNKEDAKAAIFGYSCGNDLSCRDAQMRSGQWLIGKALPGFGPCGPCITTADSIDPDKGLSIKSYVNGELRQNGNTTDMIFNCAQIVSYASKYIKLMPGDLIYTGTPSGVAFEEKGGKHWLEPGDAVEIVIEGIGTLINDMI